MPPVAVLLDDPDHREYTAMDFKLMKAFHIREDMMVGNVPIYWDQSDRVAFDVKTGISKSKAATERWERQQEKKNSGPNPTKPTPGLFAYPVPKTIDGGPLPTLQEWIEEKAAKAGRDRPQAAPPAP